MPTRPTKGFQKILRRADWFVRAERLYWKKGFRGNWVEVVALPFLEHYAERNSLADSTLSNADKSDLIQQIAAVDASTTEDQRCNLIESCARLDTMSFLNAGRILLGNLHWCDAEKRLFLSTQISSLQGFHDGKALESVLKTICWRESQFKLRMNSYYDLCKRLLGDRFPADEVVLDREIVNDLSAEVRIYRGFNVPMRAPVRGRSWFHQQEGRGVYFTLSPQVALMFACEQKASFANKASIGISQNEQRIIGGKLAVAEYKVPRDKIILYHHAFGPCISECICNLTDVWLLNYKFYGFDDFIRSLGFAERYLENKNFDIMDLRAAAFARIPSSRKARRKATVKVSERL